MGANSQLVWNFENLNKLQLLKNMQIQAFLMFYLQSFAIQACFTYGDDHCWFLFLTLKII